MKKMHYSHSFIVVAFELILAEFDCVECVEPLLRMVEWLLFDPTTRIRYHKSLQHTHPKCNPHLHHPEHSNEQQFTGTLWHGSIRAQYTFNVEPNLINPWIYLTVQWWSDCGEKPPHATLGLLPTAARWPAYAHRQAELGAEAWGSAMLHLGEPWQRIDDDDRRRWYRRWWFQHIDDEDRRRRWSEIDDKDDEDKLTRWNWTCHLVQSYGFQLVGMSTFCDFFVIFLWKFTKRGPRLFVNFHKKITKSQKNHKLPTYLGNTWMWIHKFVSAERYGNAPMWHS